MTLPDVDARAVIQHFVVHDGEVGDIVWPRPDARSAVDLWLGAAGDAVNSLHLTATEAEAQGWVVFDADPTDGRPLFVVVDGLSPSGTELAETIAAAAAGTAQPVLLLDAALDGGAAKQLQGAGWRLTDARKLMASATGRRRNQ